MRRLFLLCFLLTGCMLNAPPPTLAPLPDAPPDAQNAPPSPMQSTDTPAAPDTWQMITPGLEQRRYIPNGNSLAELAVFRIDPALFDFRVHYRAGQPLTVGEWRANLPEAALIINANFFDPNYNITGLLIQDGQVFGWPYTDRGGMFTVTDGVPAIRSNTRQPYMTGEIIQQAVQAFPMLVIEGQAAPISDDGRASRRTAIGMDAQGRVIIMVTPVLGLSLTELATYLPTTDMGLVNAFALDGGRSTMIAVPGANYSVVSVDVIPAVLAIYPR